MSGWPTKLYDSAASRMVDRIAADQFALTSDELIERAGHAALHCIQRQWPHAQTLTICCGRGNNGADGHHLARLAQAKGYTVQIITLDDTLTQLDRALVDADVVVDALLGTGVMRPVTDLLQDYILRLNRHTGPILSLDLPSGLSGDTGQPWGVAVFASVTLAFLTLKPGLFTGAGPDHVGTLFFDNLQVPPPLCNMVLPCATRYTWNTLQPIPRRRRTSHKGNYGHVLIVGGTAGMSGAVALAGEAALRTGAGRVTIATHPDHAAILNHRCPELMCHSIVDPVSIEAWKDRVDVVVLGPGLGQLHWGQTLCSIVQKWDKPLICDADALFWLAETPNLAQMRVITPHPKEAAVLLGQTIETVEADRLQAARLLQQSYGGVAVLKGAGTIVQSAGDLPMICTAGNPGMATAGMGDVLSGMIAALWAQGWDMYRAAYEAVALHAAAADRAAIQGERGLIASDLFPYIRSCLQARETR